MNITVRKDTLLDNINTVIKAVTVRSTLPILECILVTAVYDGIRLMANDLEIAIETNIIQAEITETGSVALESKIFSDIVKKLSDEYVTIFTDDNNVTTISSGRSIFNILGFPGDEFPMQPQVDKDSPIMVKAVDLKNALRQTIFSVAVDDAKPVLTGELFEVKDNGLILVSVDGFRVSFRRVIMEEAPGDIQLVVPSKPLNELVRILPSDDPDAFVNIYFTDKHILFEMPGSTMVSRLLEGEFYRYELIFSEDFITSVTIDRSRMLACLERVSLIAAKDTRKNPVRIEIQEENMLITSNTEHGKARDEMNVVMDGVDIDISFNPKYLIDVLKVIDEDNVTLNFKSEFGPCIIKPVGNSDANYLVLPLKLRY